MNTTPDVMPILSSGAHSGPEKGACIMEYVSHLTGERWSDHPDCVQTLVAAAARGANDVMGDRNRQKLLSQIGRLASTSAPFDRLSGEQQLHVETELAIWAAERAVEELASAAADLHSDMTFEDYQSCRYIFHLAADRMRDPDPTALLPWAGAEITVQVPSDRCAQNSVRAVFSMAECAASPDAVTPAMRVVSCATAGAPNPYLFLVDLLDRYDELLTETGGQATPEREITPEEWAAMVELTAA